MTKVKLLFTGLLAATSLGLSSPLYAQMSTPNFYAGGSFGQTKAKSACNGVVAAGLGCDDSDTAYRIFGGYQVNRNFAAEVGYAELGKATASGVVSGVPQSGSWKARSWDIVAVGIMPLSEQFSLLGKLGIALWRLDSTLTPTGIGSVQQSPTGTSATYGLGGQYDFTQKVGMRLEWQKYKDVGNDAGVKSDVAVFSLGALYKF